MAIVNIPAQFRSFTGGQGRVEAAGETLRQVVETLESEWPDIKGHILMNGKIRPEIAIAIDSVIVESGLLHPVDDGAEIHLLPAIGGGGLR